MEQLTITTNPSLIVNSLDEKWAEVKCSKCGEIDKLKRVEIRKINRNNIEVICSCEK